VTAVRIYGSAVALVVVDGRRARITVADAPADVLDVGEEIGLRAVANRAIAGLPSSVGFVTVSREDAFGDVPVLVTTAATVPRAGAVVVAHGPRTGIAAIALARGPVLLRRAAWDSVDGWDTRVPDPARADADLAARLERAGWLVVPVPAAAPIGRHGMLGR
jgi:hypothetical protein